MMNYEYYQFNVAIDTRGYCGKSENPLIRVQYSTVLYLLFRLKANGVVPYEYFCRPNIFMYRYT